MSGSGNHARSAAGVELSVASIRAVRVENNEQSGTVVSKPLNTKGPTLPQLADFVRSLPAQFGKFDALGIAVPGLINRQTGRVAFSANIPEHSEVDLAHEVYTESGITPVLENDANAAAYGEFVLGAGRGSSNLFYATLGYGIGGALIFNGEIWRGSSGFAGEFGYIAINSDGMRLEEVASTDNIVRRTRNRFNRDHTSSLNTFDEQAIEISKIISAAENGDDFARLMLERTGTYVGTAVSTVINLLNIERIILGGPIMSVGTFVIDAVQRRARELSFTPSFEKTTIVPGSLGERAAAIGVALLAARV